MYVQPRQRLLEPLCASLGAKVDELFENAAAMFERVEFVKRRTCRRKHDRIGRAARSQSPCRARLPYASARSTANIERRSASTKRSPRSAEANYARQIAKRPRAPSSSSSVPLSWPAKQENGASRRKGRQSLAGGVDVRGLGIVEKRDACDIAAGLKTMLERLERTQAATDVLGCNACGQEPRSRRQAHCSRCARL